MTRSQTAMDYWSVLGLSPGADASSLKRAFRTQARRWHPDLNTNDPRAEDQFKLVNEAYAVLSDPLKRQAWEGANGVLDAPPRPIAMGILLPQAFLILRTTSPNCLETAGPSGGNGRSTRR